MENSFCFQGTVYLYIPQTSTELWLKAEPLQVLIFWSLISGKNHKTLMDKPAIRPHKHKDNFLHLMVFPFNPVQYLMSRGIQLFSLKISLKKLINSLSVPGGCLPQPSSSSSSSSSHCAAVLDLHLCPLTAASTDSQLQNPEETSQTKKIYVPSKHTHTHTHQRLPLNWTGRHWCHFPQQEALRGKPNHIKVHSFHSVL